MCYLLWDMKVFELVALNRELLERMCAAGVRMEDVRYVGLYMDYVRMKGEGGKVSYIVAVLAGRYGVSERKVYSILKRFGNDCTEIAV